MGEALRQHVRLPVRDRREVEEQLQLALDDRSLEGRALRPLLGRGGTRLSGGDLASTALTTGSFQLRNAEFQKKALPKRFRAAGLLEHAPDARVGRRLGVEHDQNLGERQRGASHAARHPGKCAKVLPRRAPGLLSQG